MSTAQRSSARVKPRRVSFHCTDSTAASAMRRPRSAPAGCRQPLDQSVVRPASYLRFKHWIDCSLVVGVLIIALPLLVLIGLAVFICDGRPIFFRQLRVGKYGRLFHIWKFRTMMPDAEKRTGAVWAAQLDHRVTKLGRLLRCTHLDELPQLFNVLVGEMAIVGPRPERPEFVQELRREVHFYAQRMLARPGITGLAQLRQGSDHSLADVRRKVLLDLEYIQTASLRCDIWLALQTIPYIGGQLYQLIFCWKQTGSGAVLVPTPIRAITKKRSEPESRLASAEGSFRPATLVRHSDSAPAA